MKVVFCDNHFGLMINFRGDVVRHYLRLGYEVILVFPSVTRNDSMLNEIPKGCRLISVPISPSGMNPIEDLRYLWTLFLFMKKERPDVIFTYTIKPNIYGTLAAWLAGVKSRIAMVAGLGYAFDGNGVMKRVLRFFYGVGLRASSKVVVLNNSNFDYLLSKGYVSKEKLVLFEGGEGVDLTRFSFVPNHFEVHRFIMVARMLYDKGYSEFVSAARLVKSKYPSIQFELLGPIDDKSPMRVPREVIERDQREGSITYLGVTNNVPSYIGRNGVVVVLVSSYKEGLNRSLMEACAMGRPIITSNIPGCREMVDDGKNGFLVEPKDADSLARRIIDFINLSEREKQAMCDYSYQKACSQFDVNKVIERYDEMIQSVNGGCKWRNE